MRPIQSYNPFLPQTAQILAECVCLVQCRYAALVSIAHYPFLIPNYTHTFSAKERDSETGLSYFGARYYSSDLSIWLSVDPMSDKYASLSPYVYCADNPVKLTDPDGRWIPGLDEDGNVTYKAEKGDSYDTFIKQFDCRDAGGKNKGRVIFMEAGLKSDGSEVKAGTVIKGCIVKQATGSDVLKANWTYMTKTQKAAQLIFGIIPFSLVMKHTIRVFFSLLGNVPI